MHKVVVIAIALSLLSAAAVAQVPTSGNVFFGYSYYNTNIGLDRGGLNGWEGSLEGKVFPHLGIIADFGGHYGTQSFPTPAGLCAIGVVCSPVNVSTHVEEVLFGPRVSFSVGRLRPFGQALFGVGHASTNGFGTATTWSSGFGGGVDYRLVRVVAWRFQLDYLHTHFFNRPQNNARFSTGVVIHF